MKKIFFCGLYFPVLIVFAQVNQTLSNKACKQGEKMEYELNYGLTAGKGSVELSPDLYKIKGKTCYKTTILGESTGILRSLIVKVNDSWLSYSDTSNLLPFKFQREIIEGDYKKSEISTFDRINKKVSVWSLRKGKEVTKNYNITTNIHDLVSMYLYMRNLDFSKDKLGTCRYVQFFFEDEIFTMKVQFLGREKIKTDFGKFNTIKLAPVMPNNKVFEGKDAVVLWLTDDKNKMLLKAKVKVKIIPGTKATLKLTSYKGIRHPLTSKVLD